MVVGTPFDAAAGGISEVRVTSLFPKLVESNAASPCRPASPMQGRSTERRAIFCAQCLCPWIFSCFCLPMLTTVRE